MSNYQPGIPTGTVNLDVDYQNLQGNFQQLDTTFGINHLPFSNQTAQNGYHTNINMVPFSTTITNPPDNDPVAAPGATNGFGQIFNAQINDGYDSDEVLYFLSGGGKLCQFNRNFAPTIASPGITYLPGGLIVQWGKISGAAGTHSVNFTGGGGVGVKNFINNNFGVWTTIATTSSTVNAIYITAVSVTGFSYQNTSSNAKDFYWIALGN